MVVQRHIAHQRLLQVLGAVESMRLQYIRNAPIEALDHPIGLRGSRLCQPVFDLQRLAQLIKLMLAAGLTLTTGKQAIRELLAVVNAQ